MVEQCVHGVDSYGEMMTMVFATLSMGICGLLDFPGNSLKIFDFSYWLKVGVSCHISDFSSTEFRVSKD